MTAVITLFILLLIIVLVVSYLIFNLSLNRYSNKSKIFENDLNGKKSSNTTEALPDTKWLKENARLVAIRSFDNVKLSGYLIKHKSNKYVILVHGYTSNHQALINKAKMFYNLGYGVLLYDLRAHGMSEGKYITMGVKDNYDLKNWIEFLITTEHTKEIGLFGISMGAATVMMALDNIQSEVKFAIEDCGYTSVWDEFKYQLNGLFHLPPYPFLNVCNMYSKLFAKFSFNEISPVSSLSKTHIPMLMIHGDKDTFVPFEMLDKNYKSCKSYKEKFIVKGANHAEAEKIDPKGYWNAIETFIKYVCKD